MNMRGRTGYTDTFLWKYGNRYGKTIKKLPVINRMAEKQYRRLASRRKIKG